MWAEREQRRARSKCGGEAIRVLIELIFLWVFGYVLQLGLTL